MRSCNPAGGRRAPRGHAEEQRIAFRIGINIGDIIIEEGDIYGDGVNVAARLEALAEPGGLCISGTVHDHIRDKLPYAFEDRGEQTVKNIARPVRVYALSAASIAALPPAGDAARPAGSPRLRHSSVTRRDMDDAAGRIAALVRDYLARERITRAKFAFETKLGRATVDKLLVGLFSERTLSIVEAHTGLPIHAMRASKSVEGQASGDGGTPPALPDIPSIAVLPFTNMGGAPEQDYFADGITEDIITGLSRLRWLFVIARNSSFAYKHRSVDVRQIARELGVRYLLEGSVRAVGGRIQVVGQLIDAGTGKHIWAEKYDRDLADIFAVQDEITDHVVAAIEPHLYAEEGIRVSGKPPGSIDSWGLRGEGDGPDQQGRPPSERGSAGDPTPGHCHGAELCAGACPTELGNLVGVALLLVCRYARRIPAGGAARGGRSLARRGGPMGKNNLRPVPQHRGAAWRALVELQSALNLNPSFALGRTAYGWALLRAGRFDEAIAETGKAVRSSPMDSFAGIYTAIHGLALLGARRFDEALPHLRASVTAFAEYSGHYNTLISCCGHLGLLDEAQEFIAARARVGPPLHLSVLRQNLGRFAHCEVFVEGMRKAGVPE